MTLPPLYSPEALIDLVQQLGFLPFFANDIQGFSIEECCPPQLWFADDADGPWEWKGPVARMGRCVYGKFFGGKAGFVSLDCFPDFANHRRSGYDFDSRCEEGLVFWKDQQLWETLQQEGSLLSHSLKEACNYRKGGNTGFETVITRLQMQTYVCIADFEYRRDRFGKPYGWGIARYSTPEALFGYERVTAAYCREPEESRQRLLAQLRAILPEASEAQLLKFLK